MGDETPELSEAPGSVPAESGSGSGTSEPPETAEDVAREDIAEVLELNVGTVSRGLARWDYIYLPDDEGVVEIRTMGHYDLTTHASEWTTIYTGNAPEQINRLGPKMLDLAGVTLSVVLQETAAGDVIYLKGRNDPLFDRFGSQWLRLEPGEITYADYLPLFTLAPPRQADALIELASLPLGSFTRDGAFQIDVPPELGAVLLPGRLPALCDEAGIVATDFLTTSPGAIRPINGRLVLQVNLTSMVAEAERRLGMRKSSFPEHDTFLVEFWLGAGFAEPPPVPLVPPENHVLTELPD